MSFDPDRRYYMSTDTLSLIGKLISSIIQLLGNVIISSIATIIDAAISAINYIVQFAFYSSGLLSAIAGLLPRFVWSWVTVAISCIVARIFFRKVVS